ncbi:MAG: hypothetical protein HY926_06285, partial [Elusimicrobia bacterium]|nr:hypothetical protein [Elusimicrobiota bacterium]
MNPKGQPLDPLIAPPQPSPPPARSLRRLLAAACAGAVASPAAALAVCGGRWDSRRALLSTGLGATWVAGWILIARMPWPPESYIPTLLVWNALVSSALERLAPPAVPRHGVSRSLDPATIALTAGLAYAAAAAMAAMISVLLRLAQFQATSLFGPEALAWALLALPVGAALGAYWSRMAGPASGRVAVSALAAAPLIYLGAGFLGLIVMVCAVSWGFPWMILYEPRYDLWAWLSAVLSVLVFASCAAWSGSAPTVPRVLLRVLFSVLICTAFMADAAVWRGLHAGWHMRVASGLILDPDAAV